MEQKGKEDIVDDTADSPEEAICNVCIDLILSERNLGPTPTCEGRYCEEAKDKYIETIR